MPKKVFVGITSAEDDAFDQALPPTVDVEVACAFAVAEFSWIVLKTSLRNTLMNGWIT